MVSRVPRVVPAGRAVAGDQLPARGPVAREQRFRRGGARVRAHGVRRMRRTIAPRRPVTRRSSRTASSSRSRATEQEPELKRATVESSLQVRRHVPRARARGRRARRGGGGSLRARGLTRAAGVGRAHADRALSDRRRRAAPLRVDGRRAFVVRARGLSGGRARVLARCSRSRPRTTRGGKRSSTISRRRSTSRASRRTRRRTIARRPTTSCASRNARRRRRFGPAAEYDAAAALMKARGLDGGG